MWPVHIIQDVREAKHAIGTARIAALSLENCQLTVIDPEQSASFSNNAALSLLQTQKPVLVYPADDAHALTKLSDMPPAPLLFIDASWRRSRCILQTLPWLLELPAVSINPETASRYRIRKQPVPSAISTLEAIVYCLQQLETEPERYDNLLSIMDWMIDQQIRLMGQDVWNKNYS